jgi:hypothetical protein
MAKSATVLFLVTVFSQVAVMALIGCRGFDGLLKTAEMAVIGRVVAVDEDPTFGRVARLEISQVWKGRSESRQLSFVAAQRTICGAPAPVVGEEGLYLLKREGTQSPWRIPCFGHGRYFLRPVGDELIFDGLRISGLCGTGEPKACSLETVQKYVRSRYERPGTEVTD